MKRHVVNDGIVEGTSEGMSGYGKVTCDAKNRENTPTQ